MSRTNKTKDRDYKQKREKWTCKPSRRIRAGIADFEVFEVIGTSHGHTFKERRLDRGEYPVAVQNLWAKQVALTDDSSAPKNRLVFRWISTFSLDDLIQAQGSTAAGRRSSLRVG